MTTRTTAKLGDGLRRLHGEVLIGGTDLTPRVRPLIIDEINPAVEALRPGHNSGVRHRTLVDPDGHELLEVQGTATLETGDQLASDLHQVTKLCGQILARDFDPATMARSLSTLADRYAPAASPLTAGQKRLWDALDGRAMAASELADKLDTSDVTVRQWVKELRRLGRDIKRRRGRGYYRPDSPPADP